MTTKQIETTLNQMMDAISYFYNTNQNGYRDEVRQALDNLRIFWKEQGFTTRYDWSHYEDKTKPAFKWYVTKD